MSDFRRFCIGFTAAAFVVSVLNLCLGHSGSLLGWLVQLLGALHVGAITVAIFGKPAPSDPLPPVRGERV